MAIHSVFTVHRALSKREEQILLMASKGLTDKEIALRLGIALGSIRTYWERMRRKLDARNRAEVLARSLGQAYSLAIREAEHAQSTLSLVFERSEVGLALVDQDGHFWEANAAFCRFAGIQPVQLPDSSYVNLFHNTPEQGKQELHRLLHKAKNLPIETTFRSRSGAYSLKQTATTLQLDGVTLLLVNLIDITGLKRAENLVAQNKTLYEDALGAGGTPFLMLSRHSVILYGSRSFEKLLEGSQADLAGRKLTEIVSPASRDEVVALMEKVNQGARCDATLEFTKPGGEPKHIEVRLENRLRDQSVRGILVSATEAEPMVIVRQGKKAK